MNYKKFLGAASAALVIVMAILMLATAAGAASKYKTLYKFKGKMDGGYPYAGLVADTSGNLYGTTSAGGDLNTPCGSECGTVFKLTPNGDGSWTESVIHFFEDDNIDGMNPNAGLIFDAAGNLYGTTVSGPGISGRGTVFELKPNSDGSWTESVLCSFTGFGDGEWPVAPLIMDHAGNLYGTTSAGWDNNGGAVFQLTPNYDGSWTKNILYSFRAYGVDGDEPRGGVILDSAGNVYGTTKRGGEYNAGVVFQLTPNGDAGWSESVLYRFTTPDGSNPSAGLIFDSAGNLYGTASWGGGGWDGGSVFQLRHTTKGTWKHRDIYSFNGDSKYGRTPLASLISDSAGNLYGTTSLGGAYNLGTVFKVRPTLKGSGRITVLHSFGNHPGEIPSASLMFDAAGNLYGTTSGDSYNTNFGSVFEITP
jgi:uncharacterized repeat protein (TIGR03803 family)